MKTKISVYKIFILFLILIPKHSFSTSDRTINFKIKSPTFKTENIIKKQYLIKLNADISNFECQEDYSYEKLIQIGTELNKLLILSTANKNKQNNNLSTLYKKWANIINNCTYVNKINFINEEFNNLLKILSNENYPEYLKLILKVYEQTSQINKNDYNFGYEKNYCTANFRLGNIRIAEKCFEKLQLNEVFGSLENADKIKLKINLQEVIFDINGCQNNSEIKDIQIIKTIDDAIALLNEIKFSICNLNLEHAEKKIETLQKMNADNLFNFDFEPEVFFTQFSYFFKKKDFKLAQEILRKKVNANQNIIREYNFYIYLQTILYYSEQKYEAAKNEVLKIMDYEQFSPILKYRVNLLGCLIAPHTPSDFKNLCKNITQSDNMDEKYKVFARMIKNLHMKSSLNTINDVKTELQKMPGSVELFF